MIFTQIIGHHYDVDGKGRESWAETVGRYVDNVVRPVLVCQSNRAIYTWTRSNAKHESHDDCRCCVGKR